MADENKYINQDGAKRLVTNFLNITDEINNDIGILFIDSLTTPSQFARHQYCYIYDAASISTEMTGSWFGIVTYDTARTDSGLVSAESGSVLCIPNSDFSSVFLARFDSETFTVVEKIASVKDLDGMFLPLSGGNLLGKLRLGNSKSLIVSQYSNPDNDNKDYNSVGRMRFTPNNNLMVEFYNRQYEDANGYIHYKGGFIKFSSTDVQIGVHDAQELPDSPSSTETSSATYRICSDGFYPHSSDKDLGSTGYKWRNLYLSGDIGSSAHRANKIYAKNLDLSDQSFVEIIKITEASAADFNKLLPTANKMQTFAISLSNGSSFSNGPDGLTSPNGILTALNSDAKNSYTPTGYEFRGHAKQTFVSIDGRTFTRYLNNAKWSKWNESLDSSSVSNPNLLDNPDFRVNQRGQTEYSSTTEDVYSCDRWKITGKVRPLENGGIEWDHWVTTADAGEQYYCDITQIRPLDGIWKSGETVTLSACVNDQVYSVTGNGAFSKEFYVDGHKLALIAWDGPSYRLRTYGSEDYTITASWMKLELGSVATPFVPPNPATELLKCQYYFERGHAVNLIQQSPEHKQWLTAFRFNTKKRINPTTTISNLKHNTEPLDFVTTVFSDTDYVTVKTENVDQYFVPDDHTYSFDYESSADL